MRLQDHLPQGVRIPGTLVVSVLAILIACSFVLSSFFAVTGSVTESSVSPDDADVVRKLLANNEVLDRSEQRFTGRSIFYIPREPRQAIVNPQPAIVRDDTPPPPPPPPPPPSVPEKYGGPAIQSVLGNEVFFEGPPTLRIPQGETDGGVKVVLVRGPFNVRLGWRGGEYDVDVFSETLPDCFTTIPFADGESSNLFSVETSTSARQSSTSSNNQSDLIDRMRKEREAREATMRRERDQAGNGSAQRPPAGIPEPLETEQIDEMTRIEAMRAMNSIGEALRNDLDKETRERLMKENELLKARIRSPEAGQRGGKDEPE